MSLRIQYASDIHFEFQPSKFRRILKPSAEILVLVGDIGHPFRQIYEQFLKWCSMKFKHVVLVPGNHEYHGSSLKTARQKMKKLCKKHGVVFLDRGVFELPEYGIVILGTTLWSEIPLDKSFDVLITINDYQCIEGFDLNVVNELYQRNRIWLDKTIEFYRQRNPEYQIIVATHYAPVLEITSAPIHRGKRNNCAFASDCTDIMKGVHAWIFGHTHYNTTFRVDNTIITSNQRGSPLENTGYQKDQYLVINS